MKKQYTTHEFFTYIIALTVISAAVILFPASYILNLDITVKQKIIFASIPLFLSILIWIFLYFFTLGTIVSNRKVKKHTSVLLTLSSVVISATFWGYFSIDPSYVMTSCQLAGEIVVFYLLFHIFQDNKTKKDAK